MIEKTESFISQSEEETTDIARQFASDLRIGDVVLLFGDLGMGKSVFSRAIVRALCDCPDMEVPSPTFTLVQIYDGLKFPVWHFDLYRISDVSEVYELGWDDALGQAALLIEWPERLEYLMPEKRTEIHISGVAGQNNQRHIEVKCYA